MDSTGTVLWHFHWYFHDCDLFHPTKRVVAPALIAAIMGKVSWQLVVTEEYTLTNVVYYHRESVRTKESL